MSLHVIEPGPLSLIVDLGRTGYRALGVPVGGAADRAALIQGNALVGNAPNTAAIEFALAGPTVQADVNLGCVIFGAPFSASIGDRALSPGVTFMLKAGATLKIGATPKGVRGYLCVYGGYGGNAILGSRSALDPIRRNDNVPRFSSPSPPGFAGGEGGVRGDFAVSPLTPTLSPEAEEREKEVRLGRALAEPIVSFAAPNDIVMIRCLPGPQADWFDTAQFFGPMFSVTPASNRMGLRLAGAPLTLPGRELVSEPVSPGAVQVINDGQCIVLGVDGQTIGGYPKVACMIAADLDRLGQLRPGQPVRFVEVSMSEAEAAYQERQRRLHEILLRLSA